MNRNEKGYSLVELIVTLGIFSILMLALIFVLRTSIVSYREGLFESQMQEEVQIAANQISEFLIDAYVFDKKSGDGNAYSFSGPDGDFTLLYSPTEHSLWYYPAKLDNIGSVDKNLITDKVYDTEIELPDGTTTTLKGFEISGLGKRASASDKAFKDNEATIKLNITSRGRTYSAEKDVYFRNNIEDSAPIVDPSDPGEYMTFAAENADVENTLTTGGVHDVALMRYDELDLSREFGIVYGIDSSTYSGKGFVMENPDDPLKQIGNGNNKQLTDAFKAAHSDKKYEHYVLKVDPTLEAVDSFKVSKPKILITGFDANDTKVEVYVHLDAVSIEGGSKVLRIYKDPGGMAANGYPTDITVKGINVDKAREKGVKITYDASLKKGSTPKGSYSKVEVLAPPTTGDQAGTPSFSGGVSEPADIVEGWGFAIFTNPLNKNLVLVIPNGKKAGVGKNNENFYDNLEDTNSSKKNKLTLTFYFNNKRAPSIKDVVEYEIYPAGQKLTNVGS